MCMGHRRQQTAGHLCHNSNQGTTMVERLLAAGASPNAAPPTGETALMTAARAGYAAVVRALLVRGAHVSARESQSGQTALMRDINSHLAYLAALHPDKECAERRFQRNVIDLEPMVNARGLIDALASPPDRRLTARACRNNGGEEGRQTWCQRSGSAAVWSYWRV